ncbi:MAG: UDP-N-acetylglucosamine 2-epimerase (non-hydrolyzing), partial [Alphaproteobacteria bacterium]|nr:UDP-N-acetylglucosamine 2-epimerase (non-hydrolyzing) [Alphaproteobacteria bacterium]
TTTTMAGSIASFYSGAKVCHVEAGLRTNNKLSPFPEEINRQITGRICDYHFAPTETSKKNLLKENISEDSILVTGNTVIDALIKSIEKVNENPSQLIQDLSKQIGNQEVVLVTGHRRENHGGGFERICKALKRIAEDNINRLIIYPVHLNPNVREPVNRLISSIKNIHLIEPMNYLSFLKVMDASYLILTDSGGIQEEAPSLGKPVVLMRDSTERPEAVEAGTVILVGSDKGKIFESVNFLLNNDLEYKKISKAHNPYGDGTASKTICKILEDTFNDS